MTISNTLFAIYYSNFVPMVQSNCKVKLEEIPKVLHVNVLIVQIRILWCTFPFSRSHSQQINMVFTMKPLRLSKWIFFFLSMILIVLSKYPFVLSKLLPIAMISDGEYTIGRTTQLYAVWAKCNHLHKLHSSKGYQTYILPILARLSMT